MLEEKYDFIFRQNQAMLIKYEIPYRNIGMEIEGHPVYQYGVYQRIWKVTAGTSCDHEN